MMENSWPPFAGACALVALSLLVWTPQANAVISDAQTIDGPSAGIVAVDGVAMAEDGTGGVVYRKRTGNDQPLHIYAAQLAGGRWQPPQRVDEGQAFDSYWPAIGAGNGGRLVVTWVQQYNQGLSNRLFSASLDPGASRFEPPVAIDLDVGSEASHPMETFPSLAMNPSGAAYLAYRVQGEASVFPGCENGQTRLARFDGSSWSVLNAPVNRNPLAPVAIPTAENSPKVGIDRSGNGLVAFQEWDDDRVDRVWARRVFATTLGIPQMVSPQQFAGKRLSGPADAFTLIETGLGDGAIAIRQQPGQGSVLNGPHVFLNTIPPAADDTGGTFAGPRLADGTNGDVALGTMSLPSVGMASSIEVRDVGGVKGSVLETSLALSYGIGSRALVARGDRANLGAPAALGDARGTVDTNPLVAAGSNGRVVAAWRGRNNGVAVEELRGDGSYAVRQVAAPGGGNVGNIGLAGSGLGDALAGYLQGSGDQTRVAASIVDAPPLDFQLFVPTKFKRSRRLTLIWEPARNALSGVRYSISVGAKRIASNLGGHSYPLGTRKIREGRSTVVVTATDSSGQRASVSGTLRLDRRPPLARITHRGRAITVRISDGRKGRVVGVSKSSVRISFGDGKRVRRTTRVRHRYSHRGRYRVAIRIGDRAGNRATVKRWVRVR